MFTELVDKRIKKTILVGLTVVGAAGLSAYFGLHPRVSDVGYRPTQPVPFSHKLHSGVNKISCMYCHTTVERSAHSPIPATSTCMNCHRAVKADSPNLAVVRDSWDNNKPIEWRQVHKLPDYVNFNHSRHIRAQIDCASCHGKVEEEGVVTQQKPLNMGWCLDCHRNPDAHIIPARPISGIFTGVSAHTEANRTPDGQVYPGEGRWNNVSKTDNTWMNAMDEKITAVAMPVKEEHAAGAVRGIPIPRKYSMGPENCSACHY